jgi:hypothetical protein
MDEKDLKNVVIEIDEVDLLITPDAAAQIIREKEVIVLHRLVDNKDLPFSLVQVKEAIKKGIVDRL